MRRIFETQFLAHVSALPQNSLTSQSTVQSRTLTPTLSTHTTTEPMIPEHPSRTAARQSIANMKDWWYAETAEYFFISNIRSSSGKALIRALQLQLPALRSAFAKLIQPFENVTDISVVRIFESQAAYQQYVGPDYAWSAGLWSLIYYLRKGVPAMKTEAYASILNTYLTTLAQTHQADTATTVAFKEIDLSSFQQQFKTFWQRGRSRAQRYDPLAE